MATEASRGPSAVQGKSRHSDRTGRPCQFGPESPIRSISSSPTGGGSSCTGICALPSWCPRTTRSCLVGTVVATAPELVDHVIVVDDASTDATSAAAEKVGDPRTEVHPPAREPGRGRGHRARPPARPRAGLRRLGRDGRRRPDGPVVPPEAARPDRRRRGTVHQGQPLLRRGLLRGDAASPRGRQHRDVVPDQGGLGLLGPLRPAERLHRDPPLGPRAPPARPARQAVRVRERPAHQAQRAARAGPRHPDPCGVRRRGLRAPRGQGRPAPAGDAVAWLLAPDVVEVRPASPSPRSP